MNVDLFAAGFLAGVGVVTASFITYLVTKSLEYKDTRKGKKALARKKAWQKKQIKNYSYAASSAVLAALLIGFLLGLWDGADKLPGDIWLMALPTTVSSILLGLYVRRKHKRHIALSACAVVCSIVFGLLLVNNYYRFYPTLYTVIGLQNRIKVIHDRETTTFQYAKDSKTQAHTIEEELYSPNFVTKGKITGVKIPGKVSKFNARDGWIYMPAIANGQTQLNLPVIVLMAGSPGSPVDWLNGGGVQATLDNFARLHHGITPIVVGVDPNGSQFADTECVNSPRGNVETYLAVDVPHYLKDHFNVSEDPAQWAIGGLSLGGTCGVMMVLRNPDVYHYFLDFGGEIAPEIGTESQTIKTLFGGSTELYEAHLPMQILQKGKYPNLGGFFAAGKDDSAKLVENMQALYEQSKTSGLNSVIELVGGEHTFDVWQQSFRDAMPWISNQLGATACNNGCS